MASSLKIVVGNIESTVAFGKTDQEVAQVLLWYIDGWAEPEPEGLTQAQLNKWRLDQVASRIVENVRRVSRQNRLQELRAAQASIEDQATTETNI